MGTIVRADQQKAGLLEVRLIDFAVRIIRISAQLPKTPPGRHIAGQILRCGASPAANYSEARAAESHADFLHKLRVVLNELNETMVWLRMLEKSELPNTCIFCEHSEIKSCKSEFQMTTDQ